MSNIGSGSGGARTFANRVRKILGAFLAFRFEFKLWHALAVALIAALLAGWSQGLIVVFVLLGASLLILVGAGLHTTTGEFKHSLEGLAALLSCMALLAAAYWYFIERRGVPKLNVESNIESWPIGGNALFVRVETVVENVGSSKYEIDSRDDFRLELGQVYPVLPDDSVKELHAAFKEGRKNSDGAFNLIRTDNWPLQAIVRGEVETQIEAGESDRRYFKTVIGCQEGLVLAATVLVRKKLNLLDSLFDSSSASELYWKDQSLSHKIEGCRP